MDISAIQLVGPQTSKKEIQSLYLEVYKQWRLPGSPPREPELLEEVVSSFEDHQGQKQKRHQKWQQGPSQQTSNPQGAEPLGGGGERLQWKEAWQM